MTLRALTALTSVIALVVVTAGPAHALVAKTPASNTWGASGRVWAVLQVGDRVYVGGQFSSAVAPNGTTSSYPYLFALDAATGALDTGFRPAPSGQVRALAASPDGSVLYVGGSFAAIGGASRRNLAAVDAATGAALPGWRADPNSRVDALAVGGNGRVFVGGIFSSVRNATGAAWPRAHLAALDPGSGNVVPSWAPATGAVAPDNPGVRALAVSTDGQRLYVGGDFTSVNGLDRRHLVAVGTDTGGLDPTFKPQFVPITIDIAVDAERVYLALGGAGGEARGLDQATGTQLWFQHGDGDCQAVALYDGVLYVGGHYDNFGGQVRKKLAAMDPATGVLSPFNPYFNSALGVFALDSGTALHVGGDFTQVENVHPQRYARFD